MLCIFVMKIYKMNSKQLSEMYFLATSRAIDELGMLYEDLHTLSGDADADIERVTTRQQACIQKIRYELELVKSAVLEYNKV